MAESVRDEVPRRRGLAMGLAVVVAGDGDPGIGRLDARGAAPRRRASAAATSKIPPAMLTLYQEAADELPWPALDDPGRHRHR